MSGSGLLRLVRRTSGRRGREPKPARGGDSPQRPRAWEKEDKAATERDRAALVVGPGNRLGRLKFLGLIPSEQVVLLYLLGNMLIALKFLKIWRETAFAGLGSADGRCVRTQQMYRDTLHTYLIKKIPVLLRPFLTAVQAMLAYGGLRRLDVR